MAPSKPADKHLGLGDVDHLDESKAIDAYFIEVGGKQQERRQGRTANGIPLSEGLGGVANRVQTVGFPTRLPVAGSFQ